MNVTPTATCRACHTEMELDKFYIDRSRANGRSSMCQECSKRVANERYRAKNPGATVRGPNGPNDGRSTTPDGKRAGNRAAAAKRRAAAKAGKAPQPIRPCAQCASAFQPTGSRNLYCTKTCATRARSTRYVSGNCIDCSIPFTKTTTHGYETTRCKPCQRAVAAVKRIETLTQRRIANGLHDTTTTRQPHRNSDRKRALHFGVDYEHINRTKVYERDQWTCGICAEPIDPDCAYPSMDSASLDHIIPISRGGPHRYTNVQAAHLGCNIAKADRVDEPIAV
ncbi:MULTISPECIES: HNH endonuclease [unclassified Rhodococcus (in: high G+C Gram-positive bacteria)]|uniref:HNH endonuclease n=1 Tax=unclassified Rhodococcus (in: high G+C Gram-positive bacteria) TaxID=192944 RepID=UPI000B9A284C|nr:hypothetical protein CH259_16445 [Rhodococcus sp. 05-2254-4]OZE48045.1 hypothetical protein CH261_09040 [Rhodococcus sp. 05-2254-3]OZE49256.1 hypothetical protein CH283_16825 [Rhodococcus sp. 05-2254-2]